MSLNLTLDQGNSAAKAALWQGNELVDQQILTELTFDKLRGLVEEFHPAKALCCSVTDNGPEVVGWLCRLGVDSRLLSHDTPMPLKIGYRTPGTLGVDRIAAAVGAWSILPGCNLLVVDMGTAVTYDVVSADGTFAGGNIAPGVGMRLRALRSFTARLPEVSGYGPTPLFGYDTVTAMRSGAVRGVAAELAYYRSILPPDTRVVITGGWSEHISQFLDFPVTRDSCLVTKGLLSILLYNEHHDKN